MLYKEKLTQSLKAEQNAINKMYLNELLLHWKKVEATIEGDKENPLETMVSAISAYTKNLTVAKFKYSNQKKCGFHDDHDVFKPYYLYDIVDTLLNVAGVKESKFGIHVKNKAFNTGVFLETSTYENLTQKPKLELFSSGKYYNVGVEMDFNYKLVGKKYYNKSKIYIPLIVFFIEKYYTEKHFEEIKKLKSEATALNPNAMLFCLTESVDKKFIQKYAEIESQLYVLRANFKGDTYNDIQPQVVLSLYDKIKNFVRRECISYERVVPFGHIDLVDNEVIIKCEEEQ